MTNESTIRLLSFLIIFLVVARTEMLFPRRPLSVSKLQRWHVNISIMVIDTVAMRLVLPIFPFGMSELAAIRGWGILNHLSMPYFIRVLLAFLIFDLAIYVQHRAFHRIRFFWRMHRVHHTDLDLDVTSGNRFHPFEIFVSTCIKLALVVLIGAPPLSVLLFEIVLNAASLFSHGNIALPCTVDRRLRLLLVTPDMHRIHHSVDPRETDSNFCFNFPWWDRLFGTYREHPSAGHTAMPIGLKEFRSEEDLGLLHLLVMPLKGRRG